MKKYTQADFDNFKVDEYGHKICPAGDYTAIKDFGALCIFDEGCIFGEQCIFDELCRFGERCSYENGTVKNGRYVAVDRIGSKNRKAYFYIDENGNMFVRAGCWFSDMTAFKERVKKSTRRNNPRKNVSGGVRTGRTDAERRQQCRMNLNLARFVERR